MVAPKQTIATINNYLTEKTGAYVIYGFGSAFTGRGRPASDIDIAFISERQFDPYATFMMGQELAAILNQDVDLVDLSKASTVFKAIIITTGQIIFCGDNYKRMVFEMVTLKKYAKLNEERKPIIDKMLGRS